ncbi:MAG TPA: M14 metallopeptidase family protein [Opitutaceae bacterium]
MIKRMLHSRLTRMGLGLLSLATSVLTHAAEPKITPAKDIVGFGIGDDYTLINYTQLTAMLQKWDAESERLKVVSIGTTEEGRPQWMGIITSPANHEKLEYYRDISVRMARARLPEEEAKKLSKEGKAVVWIDGGLHSTEVVNWHALLEMTYQMVSKTDDETMRFLDDVILLMPVPNPDGVELVANWYMRNADTTSRSTGFLPRLYQKYIGHDNNRDSISMNMKETINQNKVLFIDWNPQIMHNVHQTGPQGQVIFIPPFRDPFNYVVDPLIPLGIEAVGTAMHSRLVAKGMGGSAMRSAAAYSTWWNGGMRTATYFRNQIGILTEIIGNPTPVNITLVADKQLAKSDWPMPTAPRRFPFREAIDYMIEVERAAVDYASRNRETVLYNMYVMGRRAIEKGSADAWTITPKRIDALKEAARTGPQQQTGFAGNTLGSNVVIDSALYTKVLKDPAFRDPRGYIITADQADFPTAVKFINVLLKGGVEVHKATAAFTVAGKSYPAGSYVVKSAQAFRAAVMDAFEAQDHPMDFAYPGGPPLRPYDITGWTLARQMGVEYDRIIEGFEGPFQSLTFALEKAPVARVTGVAAPAGWLVSHKVNDAVILTNRLLKAGAEVYWVHAEQTVEGKGLGTGTLWIPASAAAKPVIERGAAELGIAAHGVAAKPTGAATKLKPIRIGLVDLYGGSMPSGWVRWMLEQYEFNFEVVFPQVLDAGNLKASFDVIVFPSGTYSEGRGGRGGGRGGFGGPSPDVIPEEFRSMLGSVTNARSVPPLKKFIEDGGTLLALGASAPIGEAMGLPVRNHLVEKGPDGAERPLPPEKYYIPGSVLRAKFNPANPIAFGMAPDGFVFFDDSPVFRRVEGGAVTASKVAWFEGKQPLFSGWAVGQEYLDGGELVTEAAIGSGKLVVIGFEATFRATPHSMFKLFFNGLYYGSGTPATL